MSLSAFIQLRIGTFDLDVRFEVGNGITALFGHSGAGKTLTLRAVAGLIAPRNGRITLSGRTLFDSVQHIDIPSRARRIGYVFQQYALFPHLSVEQNIAFGLPKLPAAACHERVHSLIALVDLTGFERRRPGQLSGGQQQRVALARALAPRPDLLLLDEPFAAVDYRLRRQLRRELRQIQQSTTTPMLLVTHDLGEVGQLSDSMVVMDQGRVLHTGSTTSILSEPGDVLLDLIDSLIE